MRWRMNTLRGGKALCRLCGAFYGVARFSGGGRLPYSPAGMPALAGAREPVRDGWLLLAVNSFCSDTR